MQWSGRAFAPALVLTCWTALSGSAATENLAAQACREAAAFDVEGGVTWQGLEPSVAIPQCEAALKAEPKNAAVQAYYGRALWKAGRVKEATEVIRASAAAGHRSGFAVLGRMFQDGEGVPKDDVEAVRLYRLAAEQGYAPAQNNLGAMYNSGRGIPKDDVEAVRLYRLATEQGYAEAQNNLGAMYSNGRGVPKDDVEAVRLYRLAAEQGSAAAQTNLGLMCEYGQGIPKDDVEAVRLYRLAAEQGYAAAQNNLGAMYSNGRGVPKDDVEAVRLYRLAAEQGTAAAQTNLGLMYEYGRGVGKNEAEAVRLYRLAIEKGDSTAKQQLDAISRAIGISRATGDEVHRVVLSLSNLAVEYFERGQYGEAEPLLKRALALREAAFGPDHPDLFKGLGQLAAVYSALGRYSEAEPLLTRALAIGEKAFGPDHPDVAKTIAALAATYIYSGRYSEAEPLFKRAVAALEKALGPDHSDVAIVLGGLADVYIYLGRYNEAEPLLRRALVAVEKAIGPDDLNVARIIHDSARVYSHLGRYDEAEPFYRRALAIMEKAVGPDHPETALMLGSLANVHTHSGRYSEAEPLMIRALAVTEKALGRDHPESARIARELAHIYISLGRYSEAEPLMIRALAVTEKALGPDHANVALSLAGLADLYTRLGRYSEAEPLYRRTLAALDKTFGPDHPTANDTLGSLANIYIMLGRYDEAEPLAKRALGTSEKVLGPDHPDVAGNLSGLGRIYSILGRYDKAEPLFRRALALREAALGPDHPDVARDLASLADVYMRLGRNSEVELLMTRALALQEATLGPDHPKVANYRTGLAQTYIRLGRYSEAETLLNRALGVQEKTLGSDHPETAESLAQLALVYTFLGRYDEAEPLYSRARGAFEKAFGPNHSGALAQILTELAVVYGGLGRYDEAMPLLTRALAIKENVLGANNPAVLGSLLGLAFISDRTGRISDALGFSRRAAQVVIDRLALGQEKLLGPTRATVRVFLDSHIYLLHNAHSRNISGTDASKEAFEIAQWAQHPSAAAAVSQMAARFAADSGEFAALLREQQDSAGKYQALDKSLIAELTRPSAQRSREHETRARETFAELDRHLKDLSNQLSSRFPRYAELVNPKPLSAANLQKLLAPQEALLFYHVAREGSFVWAVTHERLEWRKIAISPSDLEHKIQGLRVALDVNSKSRAAVRVDTHSDPSSGLFDLESAHALYEEILAPVQDVIAAKPHLLVVASGALTSLPFHVLVTKKPSGPTTRLSDYRSAEWLVRKHSVTVLPSVASLRILRESSSRMRAPELYLGFGDPIFGRETQVASKEVASTQAGLRDYFRSSQANLEELSRFLRRLPDTADELRTVAKTLRVPSTQIRLGADASESAVKQLPLDKYRIVHFATHALVADETKRFSARADAALALRLGQIAPSENERDPVGAEPALVLTLPDKASDLDDGLLTSSEVAQLKMNADWVILSACNTAAGEGTDAEALSGLARAFFYAGARTLLVSHWPVQSSAAVRLTTETIRMMEAEQQPTPAEALRRAMVSLLDDERDPRNADPSRWAPFVIIGTLPQSGG
jgi:TPR repeat protein/CHAT domain-containing protein